MVKERQNACDLSRRAACAFFLPPVFLLAVLALGSGCPSEATCVTGAQVTCGCPGGTLGVQVCEDNAYGPCDCKVIEGEDAGAGDARAGDARAEYDSSIVLDASYSDTVPDAVTVDAWTTDVGSAAPDRASTVDADRADIAPDSTLAFDANRPDILVSHDAGTDGGACLPLAYFCDPEDTCCEGECTGGRCCHEPGGSCTYYTQCCDPNNHICNAAGLCEARVCQESDAQYCDLIALPCCDDRLSCTMPPGGAYARCCGTNGTVLSHAEHNLCCGAIQQNHDGSITCVDE